MRRRLILWALVGLAGFAIGRAVAGSPAPARTSPSREAAPLPDSRQVSEPAAVPEIDWVERAETPDWAIRSQQVGREIRSQGLPVARIESIYRGIGQPLRRWHFVRGLVQSGPCPFVHDVIRWMQSDPDPEMRRRALLQARHLSFRSFENDPAGLRRWQETYGHRPPRDAYLDGMRSFAERLRGGDLHVRGEFLESNWNAARLCGLHLRDAAAQTGLTRTLAELASDANRNDRMRVEAFRMLSAVEPGRELLEPLARAALEDPQLRDAALYAVKRSGDEWVAEFLDDAAGRLGEQHGHQAVMSLGSCDDERAFPLLIARLLRGQDVGSELNNLTEASDRPKRDAAWWLEWWNRNSHRFGRAARGIDVLALAAREGK